MLNTVGKTKVEEEHTSRIKHLYLLFVGCKELLERAQNTLEFVTFSVMSFTFLDMSIEQNSS